MTALERRYRWLLKLLPRAYAERAGPELLGMWLDGAAPAQRWPRVAEAFDIMQLSWRLRYAADVGTSPWRLILAAFVQAALIKVCFEIFTQSLWSALSFGFAFSFAAFAPYAFVLITTCWPRRSTLQLVAAATALVTGVAIGEWTLWLLAAPAVLVAYAQVVGRRTFTGPLFAVLVAGAIYLAPRHADTILATAFALGASIALFDPRMSLAFVILGVLSGLANAPLVMKNHDPFSSSILAVLALYAALRAIQVRRTVRSLV